jgi:hypothetical protein
LLAEYKRFTYYLNHDPPEPPAAPLAPPADAAAASADVHTTLPENDIGACVNSTVAHRPGDALPQRMWDHSAAAAAAAKLEREGADQIKVQFDQQKRGGYMSFSSQDGTNHSRKTGRTSKGAHVTGDVKLLSVGTAVPAESIEKFTVDVKVNGNDGKLLLRDGLHILRETGIYSADVNVSVGSDGRPRWRATLRATSLPDAVNCGDDETKTAGKLWALMAKALGKKKLDGDAAKAALGLNTPGLQKLLAAEQNDIDESDHVQFNSSKSIDERGRGSRFKALGYVEAKLLEACAEVDEGDPHRVVQLVMQRRKFSNDLRLAVSTAYDDYDRNVSRAKCEQTLQVLVHAYEHEPDVLVQRQLLSLVADVFSSHFLQKTFGVSPYIVNRARLHGRQNGHGALVNKTVRLSAKRLSNETLDMLDEFIVDPSLNHSTIQSLPYKPANSTASFQLSASMSKMYGLYSEASATKQVPAASRSTFEQTLGNGNFTRRTCKTCSCGPCVDFGYQSWIDIKEIAQELSTAAEPFGKTIDVDRIGRTADALRAFFRFDYPRLMVDVDADVSLSVQHALGDGSSTQTMTLDNKNVQERFHIVDELREFVSDLEGAQIAAVGAQVATEGAGVAVGAGVAATGAGVATANFADWKYWLNEIDEHLTTYMGHIVRKVSQAKFMSTKLELLDDYTAFAVADYAMVRPHPAIICDLKQQPTQPCVRCHRKPCQNVMTLGKKITLVCVYLSVVFGYMNPQTK